MTALCPYCNTPMILRNTVEYIVFPEQVGHIIDLLTNRLNVVPCPICKRKIPAPVPLVIGKDETPNFLLLASEEQARKTAELINAQSEIPVNIVTCNSVEKLIGALIPWIKDLIVLPLSELLDLSLWKRDRTERIGLIHPLLLALWQEQISGNLQIQIIKNSKESENADENLKQMLAIIICDLLNDLILQASDEGCVPEILELVRYHIPANTLTEYLLHYAASRCADDLVAMAKRKDRNEISSSYRKELTCAILHAHAGKPNPRSRQWAFFLRFLWKFSKLPGAWVDPAFFLTPEIIASTTRFEDLWDITLGHRPAADVIPNELDEIREMMERFGFRDAYARTLNYGVAVDYTGLPGQADPGSLLEHLRNAILNTYRFNEDPETSESIGHAVGYAMRKLQGIDFRDLTIKLLYQCLAEARQAGDAIAAVAIISHGIEELNNVEEYAISEDLAIAGERIIQDPSFAEQLQKALPFLWLHYYNEIGNVFRYTYRLQEALEAYNVVDFWFDQHPESDHSADKATLLMNKAIVHRDLGHYTEALQLFQQAIPFAPDKSMVYTSIALLHQHTGNFVAGLDAIDKAIPATTHLMQKTQYARAHIARAQLLKSLNRYPEALRTLQTAHETIRSRSPYLTKVICTYALEIPFTGETHNAFLAQCEETVLEILQNIGDERLELAGAAVHGLITKWLPEGQAAKADEICSPYLARLEQLADERKLHFGWQLHFVHARLEYAMGRYENVWPLLLEALALSNRNVPRGQQAPFAIDWMISKEEFQTQLAQFAIDLNRRGTIGESELLRVFEFNNGREISARLNAVEAIDFAPDAILQRVSDISSACGVPVNLVCCFDWGDRISFGWYAAGQQRIQFFTDTDLEKNKLTQAWNDIHTSLKWVNPADTDPLAGVWDEWNVIWKLLGKKLSALIPKGEHVCFLPGRTCTTMPLHLIPCPDDQCLLDRYTISYAPNLITLLDEGKKGVNNNDQLFVSVSKQTDSEKFRSNLQHAIDKITEIDQQAGAFRILCEKDASLDAVLEGMARCDEVFFLTHGCQGGRRHGVGLCVSDGHYLPPDLLPVEYVPELKRFMLTWEDVEKILQSPALVISVACSSGQTTVSKGGVRFGLEQSLFAKGTMLILSPLWDTRQSEALQYIVRFCELRKSGMAGSYAAMVRQCAMDMKKTFPDPYLWAPFILNGSLKKAIT